MKCANDILETYIFEPVQGRRLGIDSSRVPRMVACGGEIDHLTTRARQRDTSSASFAALSAAAVSILVLAVTFTNLVGNTSSGPSQEQIALLEMWQRPYTTTMLWNAASDDSGSDMSDQSGDGFTQDLADSSESYEKYDTDSDDSGRFTSSKL